jgi:hypothetical protein
MKKAAVNATPADTANASQKNPSLTDLMKYNNKANKITQTPSGAFAV